MNTEFSFLDLVKYFYPSLYDVIVELDSSNKVSVAKNLISKYNDEIKGLYNPHTKENISTELYPSLLYYNVSSNGFSFKKSFEYYAAKNNFMIRLKHSYALNSISLSIKDNRCIIHGFGNGVVYNSAVESEALIKYIFSNPNIIITASKLTKEAINTGNYVRSKIFARYDNKNTILKFADIGNANSIYNPELIFSPLDNSKILVTCERFTPVLIEALEVMFSSIRLILSYEKLNSKRNKKYVLVLNNTKPDNNTIISSTVQLLNDEIKQLNDEIGSNNDAISKIMEDAKRRCSFFEDANLQINKKIDSINNVISHLGEK